MSEKNTILSVKDLSIQFSLRGQTLNAIRKCSLDLCKGETLAIVGESGSGKSVFTKTIVGMLDQNGTITGGSIEFEGQDLAKFTKEKEWLTIRGRKIAMVMQDPMTALNPVMTIGDQIAGVISLHSEHGQTHETKQQAIDMLKMVGITPERYDDFPHQFSGGMKQRVVIAIALACNPELLLADEPTTALDVTIQAQVLDMIRNLRDTYNTALILITHDLGVIAEMCDEVAVIYAGEIIEYGTLRDIFKETAHPYTKGLFEALPDLNSEVERLTPIEGLPVDPTHLPDGCKFAPRCPYATEACRKGDIPYAKLSGKHISKCLTPKKAARAGSAEVKA